MASLTKEDGNNFTTSTENDATSFTLSEKDTNNNKAAAAAASEGTSTTAGGVVVTAKPRIRIGDCRKFLLLLERVGHM